MHTFIQNINAKNSVLFRQFLLTYRCLSLPIFAMFCSDRQIFTNVMMIDAFLLLDQQSYSLSFIFNNFHTILYTLGKCTLSF